MPASQPVDPRSALGELRTSTERLMLSLSDLTDAQAREPSRLPGWTRGHVVTHLARNADGLVNLVRWAATGEPTPMYASPEARATAIDEGAGRPAMELRLDLADACRRLDAALDAMPEAAFGRVVPVRAGVEVTGGEIPLLRIREVEIHHDDLRLDYTPAHWTAAFAARSLDQITPTLGGRDMPVGSLHSTDTDRRWRVAPTGPELSGPEIALLAWLTGRSDGDGLLLDGASPSTPIPRAPQWA